MRFIFFGGDSQEIELCNKDIKLFQVVKSVVKNIKQGNEVESNWGKIFQEMFIDLRLNNKSDGVNEEFIEEVERVAGGKV